jgi:hypothetical protein
LRPSSDFCKKFIESTQFKYAEDELFSEHL